MSAGRQMFLRSCRGALLCFGAAMMAWAGSEFPARPGEQVVPNEIVVRLRPGAVAAALIPNYLPGAQIEALRQERLFKITVPTPIPAGIATQLAANATVDFVEPNRRRTAGLSAP